MSTPKFPIAMLAQHLAIVGKAGSGKTYAAKGLVEHLLAEKRRVCILDPTGVWYGLRSSADGKRPGWPVAVFGGPHADVAIADQSGAALAHLVATKNLPTIIDLSEMLIGQRHRFVTDFAESLYRDNRAPLHLVIDEADEFCPQNPLPETKRMLHHVDRIVRRGRVRGFRVCLITQRPAVLHKNVLTQANTLIAMRLTAPQDRNAIKAWVDGQGDALQGKAVLDSLARLPRGEGWVWAPELDFLSVVAFPKITTFDSSRAPDEGDQIVEPTKLAAVDLAEIKASFDAVEQEARTLAELKTENATLKRRLVAAEKQVTVAGPSEAEVQKHIDDAVRAAVAPWHEHARSGGVAVRDAVNLIRSALEDLATHDVANVSIPNPDRLPPRVEVAPRLKRAPAPRNGTPHATVEGLRAGAVRILQELAARAPAGYSRPQVGLLTKFSHKGGTFGTYFSDLRRSGFIEERGGLVYATDAGVASLGDKVPDAPTSHDDAMAMWRKSLRSGAFAMLEAIVAAGPNGIDRDGIAYAVGMAPSGGTFGTYLSDLRRNGLITERDKRCIANDILFPKGRA